jgi:hypothetical protein
LIAWGTQDGGEQADRPWIVRAATLAPGARRFSKAQTLDPGRGINRPHPEAGAGSSGSAKPIVTRPAVSVIASRLSRSSLHGADRLNAFRGAPSRGHRQGTLDTTRASADANVVSQ